MTSLAHRLFPTESGPRAVMSLIAAGFGTIGAVLSVILVIVAR